MNNDRVGLYESLVRLSFIVIFMFALAVGTVGLFSICRMLLESEMPQLEFITRDLS